MYIINLLITPSIIVYEVHYESARTNRIVQYIAKYYSCFAHIEITRAEYFINKFPKVTKTIKSWSTWEYPIGTLKLEQMGKKS